MKIEDLLKQALDSERGIKVETDDISRLRNAVNNKARKLNIRVSTIVPASTSNQLWIIPKDD